MTDAARTPAIEGWFTTGRRAGAARRRGARRAASVFFPPTVGLLPQPGLRRRGVRGAPSCPAAGRSGPTPTRSTSRRRRTSRAADPYVPFALAAVELPEGIVVLGQLADGYGVDDLRVGTEVELVVETLYTDDDRRAHDLALEAGDRAGRGGRPVSTRRRRPRGRACTRGASGASNFVELRRARGPRRHSPTAGVAWEDVDLVVGGETVRNGYGGYVAGATFAQALGWNGARVATSYAACATGAQALDTARARILAGLCEVALVVGADTTPKGFLAPNAGERWDDPDWLRFRLLGMTNPAYFALYARRRMDLYGATPEDFAAVKVKNARHGLENPNARYRKEVSRRRRARQRRSSPTRCTCSTSARPPTARPRWCSRSMDYAQKHGLGRPGAGARDLDGHADLPATRSSTCRLLSTDPSVAVDPGAVTLQGVDRRRGLRGGRHRARRTSAWPRSTTCRPRSSSTGSRTSRCASAARPSTLLRAGDTTIGGRIPVNPRGGLACFGEAVPAQALAQVCEVTWQLRGQADRPPGRGRPGRHHRQPGPVRPRLVGDAQRLSRPALAVVQSVLPSLRSSANRSSRSSSATSNSTAARSSDRASRSRRTRGCCVEVVVVGGPVVDHVQRTDVTRRAWPPRGAGDRGGSW